MQCGRGISSEVLYLFKAKIFRDFFGNRVPNNEEGLPERRAEGLGSGVIVGTEGHILTNHHVIDGAERIRVELRDGRILDLRGSNDVDRSNRGVVVESEHGRFEIGWRDFVELRLQP